MNNKKMMRSLAAMSLVIALFAGTSRAAFFQLPAGTFSVLTHTAGVCSNPNGFPVVTVAASQLTNGLAGFLLDGSESASEWLKTLQDAAVNNRKISLYTDDNIAHAYCGQIAESGYTVSAYKILTVIVGP
jgi:hypothetical protein